ncbi:Farnesyl diphosphate synthase [bacterium HR15]|nr:Farnesyl diphosphate synthase [bacterium HR15]
MTINAELDAYLQPRLQAIEQALERWLPAPGERPRLLPEAMRYAVLNGGKRLRPILCIAAAEAVGGTMEQVLPTACALELIHTFSLVHDDLPALDNDTLRRGKPTCHVQFGEAIAILAGDALFAHAFRLIAQQVEHSPPERVVHVLKLVADAVGVDGMVGGQVEDILSEREPISPETLAYIHSHKTGALLRASVLSGAILCGATPAAEQALDIYGTALGLAFQIVDDILNETGDPARLGKATGTDRARQKATYPRLYGLEASRLRAQQELQNALDALKSFGAEANPLRWLAHYVVERER